MRFRARLAFAACALCSSAAFADDPPKPLTFTGNATFVSDYLYRGLSFSNGRPALQGELIAATSSGLYGDLFASTISFGAARQEFDFTAGHRATIAGWNVDVAVSRYTFPGGRNLDYWELPIALSRTYGDWTWTGSETYVPAQSSTQRRSNNYTYARLDWRPRASPYSAFASLGYENGAFGNRKVDWALTGARQFRMLRLSVSLIGRNQPRSSSVIVSSIAVSF